MARKAKVARKTSETDITVELDIDGKGTNDIKTPIPFLDHMLTNMSRHGLIDLKVRAKGDIEVDYHHTVEDVGICLGEAVKKAVGDKKGITRCGSSTVPMMDALATVVIDISGRPYFRFNSSEDTAALTQRIFPISMSEEGLDIGLVREFMTAFANSSGADLHITLHYGTDLHHSIESIFKAFGRALRESLGRDPRIKGVLSTKGKL
jgi:imidazoleglycerol-phosphate dehydratase